MTKKIGFLFLLSGVAAILLSACGKDIDKNPPVDPGPIDNKSYVQFTVTGMQLAGGQFYALVSIEDKNGQTVVNNKKITVDQIQASYKTDKIELAKGEFKLTRFVIVKASDTAVFAAPKANTPKAAMVANPLAITLNISKVGMNDASVQVVKIESTDAPVSFGYTSTDFGFEPFFEVKVKLKINLGQVVYDSLPGKLLVDAVNADGAHWTREIDLQKGITAIRVPDQYKTFKFQVNKWNLPLQKQFAREELPAGTVVSLEGNKAPKRLVEEASFTETGIGLRADSRSEYFYNAANRLSEVKFYQRSTVVSGLPLTFVHKFLYNGNELDSIKRYNDVNALTGYSAFFWTAGKISGIDNKSYDQQTSAGYEYKREGGLDVIEADYIFHNGNTMTYKLRFANGNKVSDHAQTSTGGSEGGIYEYDDNINPKHQLGWHDLYFTNASKNNQKFENKGYGGAIPSVVPYKTEFVYDEDGYPVEVWTSYKSYSTQQHLYRTKKTYRYQ